MHIRGTLEIILLCTAICLFAFGAALVAAEPSEIPIWPDGLPDNAIVHTQPESTENRERNRNEFGFNRAVFNVSHPTFQVFKAPESETPAPAVLIFPGGGFSHLAIDKEGKDVARFLNSVGVTGVVVKYRTRPEEIDNHSGQAYTEAMSAIMSDGRRTVQIVRQRASEWGIDPNKIGVMGFSAGGRMAVTISTAYDTAQADSDDPVLRVSSRPDFAGLVYPGIPDDIYSSITADTPPMFLVCGGEDETTPPAKDVLLFQALRKADVKAEIHIYTRGWHGFGLGLPGDTFASWPELFATWLREIDMLPSTGN
ncbi:MAG: alpha/beta hydrolase [Candidatus Glassbacteria bacterium]|nr:alpha/beta hydrolase [Candidatus Glassbacteria bacterium]